jgi:hypothetical protein
VTLFPQTAAPALLSPAAPGPELPPQLRMIPVTNGRPLPETADYVARCADCGTAKRDLVRRDGQLVCADRFDCYQAWRR